MMRNWHIYEFCDRLTHKYLVADVFKHSALLFIIESARIDTIIGFRYKPNEWIAFANNAIYNHKEYWEYIELAFKSYGLWDKLIQLDKKGTFQKKVHNCYADMPIQQYDVDEVFRDLFSDLWMDTKIKADDNFF